MNKKVFAKNVGLALYFVVLSVFPSTAAWAQKTSVTAAAQGPQQVVVTNTAGQAVPTSIQGTVNVNVGNAIAVHEPSRVPIKISQTVVIANGDSAGLGNNYNIPSGMRLVLQQFSMDCLLSAGAYAMSYVTTPDGDVAYLPTTLMPWPSQGAGYYRAVGTSPIHWTQDSGFLQYGAQRSGTSGTGACVVVITGYLTPLAAQ